jgi:hypothetical protein
MTVSCGRNQEVKGGPSTRHAEADVVSRSEGIQIYSDSTAAAARIPRGRDGWAATCSNVNPSTDRLRIAGARYFDYS